MERFVIFQPLLLGSLLLIQVQGTPLKVTEEKPGLLKQAKLAPDAAIAAAQARFPTGTIKSGEIEKEGGKLIYSFDIQLPGVKGIEEVHVDAATGAVLKTEHESPPKRLKKP
jgi:uncharacterized membrane protein YkoI